MLSIPKVKTQLFIRELETRGSFPSLFECDDGHRYIVKHSQQGRNFRHLINEFIAANLAKITLVPIPDYALIDISESILPDDIDFSRGKPSGLGFGSKLLPGRVINATSIHTIINLSKNKEVNILDDYLGICFFDIWLRNSDRSFNNPNLLIRELNTRIGLFAIDHSSIFSELDYLKLGKEMTLIPPDGETLLDTTILEELYYRFGLMFVESKNRICERIRSLEEKIIFTIVYAVPKEWGLSKQESELIIKFINSRKLLIEEQFNKLSNSIGN